MRAWWLLLLVSVCSPSLWAASTVLPPGGDWRGARLAVSGDRDATVRDAEGRRLFAVHAEGAEGATLRDLKLEATREALLVDARECWSRGKVSKLSFVGENADVTSLAGGARGWC